MQIPGALPMPAPEPVGAVSNPTYYQPTSPTYGQENAPSGGTGIGGYLGNLAQGGYTGVNQTVDLASRYGGEAGGFLGSHVYTNPIGGGLGGDTGVTTPKQRQEIGKVGEIGGGIAPMAAAYAVAPEIGVPTTVLDAYFAARGLQGAKSTWDAYQSGQIDAKTALTQALVQDLPNLIPAGIHGIRLAPEIKATVERLSQTPEAQGALKFAASERGSLGTPPEGEPAETGAAGAGQPAPPSEPSAIQSATGQATSQAPQDVQSAVESVIGAVRRAEAISPEQERLRAAERSQRTAEFARKLQSGKPMGEAMGALGGEQPKVAIEPPKIAPEATPLIQDHLERGPWTNSPYGRLHASTGFGKLLAGAIPQDNELEAMRKAFNMSNPGSGDDLVKAILAHRSAGQKAFDEFVGTLGLPQTFATSFDMSAFLRQSAPLGVTYPKEWGSAFVAMVKAAGKEDVAQAIHAKIDTNPWISGGFGAADADKLGYGFKEIGGHVSGISQFTEQSAREPAFASLNRSFISHMAQKFPGIRQSERAFVTMMDKLRTDVYSKVAQQMWDGGERDLKQYRALAKVINHTTGWGDFKVGQLTQGINAFFSPRNTVARFQVLFDPFLQPGALWKPSARQVAARALVGYAGANATLLALVGATGLAAVELNPLSADWGKARSEATRFDFTGGYGPLLRTIVRMQQGGIATSTGRKIAQDWQTTALQYIQGKLGPIPSFLTDVFSQQRGVAGEKFDVTNPGDYLRAFRDSFTPFMFQDVYQAAQQSGPVQAAIAAPLSFFGAGVQSYASPARDLQEAQDNAAQAAGYKDYADAQQKLGPNAAKAQFATDQGVQKAQAELDKNPSPFKDAISATEPDYAANDAKLEAGQETGQQWRDQKKLIDASRARGIIDALKGKEDQPTGDPILDGYYDVFKQYTNPKSGVVTDSNALSDALDAYQAKLSPEDRARLDANTGTSAVSPTMQRYRTVTKGLSDAGWFDLSANLYKQGGLDKYAPDIGGFIRKYGKLPARFNTALGKLRLQLLMQHPELAKGAVQFGFATSRGAAKVAGQ